MRWLLLCMVLTLLAACGGVGQVHVDVPLPRLDLQGNPDSFYQNGWALLQRGQTDEALACFQKSVSAADVREVGFGFAALQAGNRAAARRNFEKALALNPDQIQAQIGLAVWSELEHDRPQAFSRYAKLNNAYPAHSWIKAQLERLKNGAVEEIQSRAESARAAGNMTAYINALQDILQYAPERSDLILTIAQYYTAENKLDQAIAYLQIALDYDSQKIDVLEKLLALYDRNGNADAAFLTVRQLQRLKPNDPAIEKQFAACKDKLQGFNWPPKFKAIFLKNIINKEELAALLGYYFGKEIGQGSQVQILTDLENSFARDAIIKLTSTGIMKALPDHVFDRFQTVDRMAFAATLQALISYLRANGKLKILKGNEAIADAADITREHKYFVTIQELIKARILYLDGERRFNPTEPATPFDVLVALKTLAGYLR